MFSLFVQKHPEGGGVRKHPRQGALANQSPVWWAGQVLTVCQRTQGVLHRPDLATALRATAAVSGRCANSVPCSLRIRPWKPACSVGRADGRWRCGLSGLGCQNGGLCCPAGGLRAHAGQDGFLLLQREWERSRARDHGEALAGGRAPCAALGAFVVVCVGARLCASARLQGSVGPTGRAAGDRIRLAPRHSTRRCVPPARRGPAR